jgi:hypothetical protein
MEASKHNRVDVIADRCVCGGVVVFFEDGDEFGVYGEGCEVAEHAWPINCKKHGWQYITHRDGDCTTLACGCTPH